MSCSFSRCSRDGDCEGLGTGTHAGELSLTLTGLSRWLLGLWLSPSQNQPRTRAPSPQHRPMPSAPYPSTPNRELENSPHQPPQHHG